MEEILGQNRSVDPLALGEAYLEYCVKQGWLAKVGEGGAAQYELTPAGQKKLADVPFNFDLSKLTGKGETTKKKRQHRK